MTGLRSLTPVAAAGRTATAIGGIADCGLVLGMTRGRAWIVVLGILLGGIVALNVWGLSLNAASSATASKIDELERSNSVLRTRVSTKLSNTKVAAAAAELGLSVPAADEVRYLKAGDGDIARAAKRLAEGAIASVATAVTPPAADQEIDPVTGAAVDPAVTPADPTTVADPATTDGIADPTTADPATADPATATTDPAATATDTATTDPATTDTAAATTPPADPATGAVAP